MARSFAKTAALLQAMHDGKAVVTVKQALILLRAAQAEREGSPYTLPRLRRETGNSAQHAVRDCREVRRAWPASSSAGEKRRADQSAAR